MRRMLATALLACLTGCGPMTSPSMGTAVSGERFEREIAGQMFSFRLPDGVQDVRAPSWPRRAGIILTRSGPPPVADCTPSPRS
jgi:hypothetical protein